MTSRGRGLTRVLLAALLLAASLHIAAPARAKTLTVCPDGCEFETIADALAAAGDGDVIGIGEGVYDGGIVVDKDVTLRGAGRDTTAIRGTSDASVVRVRSGANVTIEAVTIMGGGGSPIRSGVRGGGGILNEGGLSLRDSIVRDNTASGGEGGGVFSASTKRVTIRNAVIRGNQAADGGGIHIGRGDVEIEDTTIAGNRSTRNGGGILERGGETLRLERCDIVDNRADQDGGGVLGASEVLLIDSRVTGNRATNGGGLIGGRELLKIVNGTVSGNTSAGSGGGIRVGPGGVQLVDSVVEQNQTRANGAGIFASSLAGDISLKDSTITGNVASQDGGGILTDSSEVTLDNSTIATNQAGRDGGGIYARIAKKGLIKLRNGSVVAGNQPNQCAPLGLKC